MGNLKSIGQNEYNYTSLGELENAKVATVLKASFAYDGGGRLVSLTGRPARPDASPG